MATFVKFNKFLKQMGEGAYHLNTDALKFALTNTAPTPATDTVFLPGTLHPPPAATNGYPSGGAPATGATWGETGGVATMSDATDITFTASGGDIGPFRYIILYDDTPTTPLVDPLIGYWDYGVNITLLNGETFTADVTTSLFSIT